MKLTDLSHREQEVVLLMKTGMPAKEAAFKLGISYKTIVVHLTHISNRLKDADPSFSGGLLNILLHFYELTPKKEKQ